MLKNICPVGQTNGQTIPHIRLSCPDDPTNGQTTTSDCLDGQTITFFLTNNGQNIRIRVRTFLSKQTNGQTIKPSVRTFFGKQTNGQTH